MASDPRRAFGNGLEEEDCAVEDGAVAVAGVRRGRVRGGPVVVIGAVDPMNPPPGHPIPNRAEPARFPMPSPSLTWSVNAK